MKKSISTLLLALMALFMCQRVSAQTASFYFEETELTYDMASSTPFEEPKLINPNGDYIQYYASPASIVGVKYDTGEVTFFGEGLATITAQSYNGEASYTVQVTDSRQDPGLAYSVAEISYDMSTGEPFVAPELINPNGLAVTYTTSDFNVAIVDYYTGALTIKGVGEVVVGATTEATDVYKAGKAEYKLTVFDPSIIASYPFSSTSNDGWKEDDSYGIWMKGYYGGLYCDGSYKGIWSTTSSYYVSPEIDFPESGTVLTFEQMAYNFVSWKEEARVVVREIGGEWIDCGDIPQPGAYDYETTGKIKLPEAINGKKGQIAFKYVTDGSSHIGQWYIKNVLLKKYVKKLDPQISYDAAEVEASLGQPFQAPVLNNPNNLNIEYTSSNEYYATVDKATGEVTILNEGTVEITAKSPETKEYDEGRASYKINIIDKSKLLVASFYYDLCGFTTEGTMQTWSYYYNYAYAQGGQTATELTPNYLVSPEFQLKTQNTFAFDHMPDFPYGGASTDYYKVAVRLSDGDVKGDWVEIAVPEYVPDYYGNVDNTGLIAIPEEFNNKKVQFALVYYAVPNVSWTWWVRNLVIRGVEGASKEDPAIAFDQAEVAYTMGEEFTAPVLANPNNVAVTYSSSDEAVATVDAEGIVTVLGAGVTTIKAVSAETEQYLAGEASYVLTVSEAAGAAPEVLFEETFASNLGSFVVETENASSTFWQWFFITQSAYAVGEGVAVDARLVSPEIQLANDNVVKFSYRAGDFTDLASQIMVSVREVGGEWTNLALPVLDNEMNWQEDVEIAIPAEFNNKNVQVAFWYNASNGTICIKNMSVLGVKGAAPVEKLDPQISYEVESFEMFYNKETGEFDEVYQLPELVNPNNVPVKYSADNALVITVDELTGEVTVLDYGVAVITATSEETEEYKSATASYTLTVSIPTGIAGITADDLMNGKVYNLQGVRVDKLGKGIYIVNGKKIVVK